MLRFALVLTLVFLALGTLRILRVLLASFFRRGSLPRGARREVPGEMVRDPVCGTWIDRRLAISGRQGGVTVPVCSEECRNLLEAG